jgi:hypothetical protein
MSSARSFPVFQKGQYLPHEASQDVSSQKILLLIITAVETIAPTLLGEFNFAHL